MYFLSVGVFFPELSAIYCKSSNVISTKRLLTSGAHRRNAALYRLTDNEIFEKRKNAPLSPSNIDKNKKGGVHNMTNEDIVKAIQNGFDVTENMQWLYQKNLPLIKIMIRPFTLYENEEDLLQEAYFGLWEAVQRYETSENVLFMTYAGYWIRQAVRRYIENCGSVIRIPGVKQQKIIRYNKAIQELSQKLGRTPANNEIADYMKINEKELEELEYYSQSIASLDVPINEDSESTLSDSVKSDFELENSVIDKMYDDYTKSELWRIVERYTGQLEKRVIREYYLHNKSLAMIADKENLSISRIKQVKARGFRRLRSGQAKEELLHNFENAESGLYRNGMQKYSNNNFTSTVEKIALSKYELKEEYEKRLAEIIHCES